MYHTIEFSGEMIVDLEGNRSDRLERVRIRKGTQIQAQIKPYVAEGLYGPIEVADLFFEDGSATRQVPFSCFFFVD